MSAVSHGARLLATVPEHISSPQGSPNDNSELTSEEAVGLPTATEV